jgi:hypothetical protein
MGGGRRKAGLTGATARATSSSAVGRGGGGESVVTAGEESEGSVAGAVAVMVEAWRRRAEEATAYRQQRGFYGRFFLLKPITGRQFTEIFKFYILFFKKKKCVTGNITIIKVYYFMLKVRYYRRVRCCFAMLRINKGAGIIFLQTSFILQS